MENNIEVLKVLEGIYKVKFDLEEKQRNIPKYLEGKFSEIEELEKNLLEMESRFEEYQKEDSSLKLDIQDINAKKARAEEKIDSIKTQREYEALEKELEAIVNEEVSVRKKSGYVTGLKSKIEKEISELKLKLQEEKDQYNSKSSEMKEELSSIDHKLEEVNKRELEYSVKMNEDFLFKFERIIKNKSNGVVPLVENVCRGCYMILPVEFANKIRKDTGEVKFCPYCSRILYYQEKQDNNDEIISGGLADLVE